jgi:surface polysaccharide O-acyltransferase-like enzyme
MRIIRMPDSDSPWRNDPASFPKRLMQATAAPVSVFRLRFIDMARALAILLMLEGHFIDVTLAPKWRVSGNPLYEVWLHLRGMAAPMFFMVTGLIFAYLLSGATGPGFIKVKRVRRGLLRAAELMFWGYLLQVNLRQLPGLLRGKDAWFQSFHVLQCIAVGLLVLILVFGIVRKAGPWALAGTYLALGLAIFLLAMLLANHAGPLPLGAPAWLQNPVKAAGSTFPLAPWLGFTLYGAAIGVLLRWQNSDPRRQLGVMPFLLIGIPLSVLGWPLDRFIAAGLLDVTGHPASPRVLMDSFHGRIGEILLVLGFLVWMERRLEVSTEWLQTIGRNTFPVYVIHVIVLYGGIFGFGLNDWLHHSLNPWQAGVGSLFFCAFFGFFAQWMEPLALRWREWRGRGRAA